MIEHAGHQVAVDSVENEDDAEHEQRNVAFACVFDDQQYHEAADQDVLGVVRAITLLAERHVVGVHVIGAVQREQAIGDRDHVVHADRQVWIEVVLAQRVQREQHVNDRDQGHGQHHGSTCAGPIVVEQIYAEGDGSDVINDVERERRLVLRRGIRHREPLRLLGFQARRAQMCARLGSGSVNRSSFTSWLWRC